MKKRFSIISTILILVLLFSGCATNNANINATATSTVTGAEQVNNLSEQIVILYTNDVHCAVSDGLGYKSLMTVKNAMLTQTDSVFLVDSGDFSQGDTIGALSKGEYIIDLMNMLGYDAAIPGNHEFDYSMNQFLTLVKKANFPIISANFKDSSDKNVLPSYTIIEKGGVKVGFVGISTPYTITSSTPTYFQNDNGDYIYSFCQDETGDKLYNAVQQAVDEAKSNGAQYVIALTHLGNDSGYSPWSSIDVINHTNGIDAVLDGHAHNVLESQQVTNKDGKQIVLSSTGTKLENIGCLSISGGEITAKLINDNKIGEEINKIQKSFEELLNKVVASSKVQLCMSDPVKKNSTGGAVRLVRNQETNLGDLCADAYRAATGAQIAFVNGGGIRADIPAGQITYGQIIKTHPYGNEVCMVSATGQEILDALELGSSNLPGENGGFLQVSGLTYEVDLSIPSSVTKDVNGAFSGVSGKYRVTNVKVDGVPLDLTKNYTIASHNYMIKSGGDGFSMFIDNELLLDSIVSDYQCLINFITENQKGIVGNDYSNPYGDGRITIR